MPRLVKPTALQLTYDQFNGQWFNGHLSNDILVVWSRSMAHDTAGDFDDIEMKIRINSALRRWRALWQGTLLHEMAHVATHTEEAEHGPRWLREMHRLARAGALDTIW